MAGHLHEAGRVGELRALLADVAWIQARLAGGQLPGLVSDYGYASDPLTSGGPDRTVRVWDLATGQQQATLAGHDGPVRSVAVTADRTRAVSGGTDGTVRVWDLATGKEVARWTGDHAVIACTVLSGQPFKIAVGQFRGQPYLLEFRGQENTT